MTNKLLARILENTTFEKKSKAMSDNHEYHDNGHGHHESKNDTFFEESTAAIGFLYTIVALGIILTIYFFG